MTKITADIQIAYPKICFIIKGEIIYSFLLQGFLLRSPSNGGSVAKAKAAKESIIKLNQSIWTGEKIASFKINALIKVVITATTFAVN